MDVEKGDRVAMLIHAFIYALMRVLSGHFDTALVLSVTKASEIPQISTLTHISSDPFYQRPVGICDVTAAALQATKYVKERGAKEEDFAEVCVKNLKNTFYNEKAYRKMLITVKDVLSSPYVVLDLVAKLLLSGECLNTVFRYSDDKLICPLCLSELDKGKRIVQRTSGV